MDEYLDLGEVEGVIEEVGEKDVLYYEMADSIIENIIDGLIEYEIDGLLHSNLQQQIIEIIKSFDFIKY